MSFGYKHGLPIDVDLVFDCRFLPNPHWVDDLRPLSGTDPRVRDYVLGQPETGPFLDELERLFALLLPAYVREGKSYLSIGIGCTGGRHRSVVIATELARLLERARCVAARPPPRRRTWLTGPRVVALGGGHGLATALRAVRQYAGSITAVVSVADDGGSSGRLRRDLGVPPPGDIRRCLVALADDDSVWSAAFEHRFREGELEGHALGNLVLVGLTETLGQLPRRARRGGPSAARRGPGPAGHGRAGRPEGGRWPTAQVEGQVAVANSLGIRRVELVPADVVATPGRGGRDRGGRPGRLRARVALHQRPAGAERRRPPRPRWPSTAAQVVQVANLRPQIPETAGLDAADHLAAVLAHGARVDRFLYDRRRRRSRSTPAASGRSGWNPSPAAVARADGLAHDPGQLAKALRALL